MSRSCACQAVMTNLTIFEVVNIPLSRGSHRWINAAYNRPKNGPSQGLSIRENCGRRCRENLSRQSGGDPHLFGTMAEGVGFEPTVALRLLLISSQVPLTTQPPFPPLVL